MDDSFYHPIYEQAKNLQYKFHDFTGGNAHPEAHALQNEIRQLVEDIEVKKNPHTIEDHIKTIQRQLRETQHSSQPFMNYDHHDYLHDNYEQLRQNVRQSPHY